MDSPSHWTSLDGMFVCSLIGMRMATFPAGMRVRVLPWVLRLTTQATCRCNRGSKLDDPSGDTGCSKCCGQSGAQQSSSIVKI